MIGIDGHIQGNQKIFLSTYLGLKTLKTIEILNIVSLIFFSGKQYRSVDCNWGGKPCLGFRKGNIQVQRFCDEPDIRELFPTKINYNYVLRCDRRDERWKLCYNDYCERKYECVGIGDRKFRYNRFVNLSIQL